MKNRIWIYTLIVMGLLVALTNCCKEDNTASKKGPIITWETPVDIPVGTLLSATQLNATADVPGNFAYTPALETELNVGENQDLKVDFTPTDAANYNVASKTVKINVIQGVSSAVFNSSLTYGIMTDLVGNTYKTIVIGTQTWMAENLRVTKYRNGDPIFNEPNNTAWIALTAGAYCSYSNTTNIDEIATYGRLYNWYAISDNRNIAPTGWHVPTDTEWATLITTLNGKSVAGGVMKEAGTTHWRSPNTSATNESGFTALPSGYRSGLGDGVFNGLGGGCQWWSSTAYGATNAWYYYLAYYYATVIVRDSYNWHGGSAVRLVKD
jgi:uncharacterized protein (TIGR02145 family)